jgi:hypothetical protein
VSRVLHQLRFDLLRLRPWLWLWAAALVAQGVLVAWQGDSALIPQQVFQVQAANRALLLLKMALGFLLAPVLIQTDPPHGSSGFWLVRPLSGGQMLASKLLTIALLSLSSGAAAFLALLLQRVPALLAALAAGHDALTVLTALLICVLVASLTNRPLSYFGASGLLALAVAAVWLGRFSYYYYGRQEVFPPTEGGLVAAAELLVLILPIAAILHQYLTRRTGRTLALSAGLALATAGVTLVLPETSPNPPFAASMVPRSLKVEALAPSPALVGDVLLHRSSPDQVIQPLRIKSRLESGGTAEPFGDSARFRTAEQQWEFALDGRRAVFKEAEQKVELVLSQPAAHFLRRYRGQPIQFQGRLALRLYRLRPTARMHLAEGVEFATRAGTGRIGRVIESDHSCYVEIQEPVLQGPVLPRGTTEGIYGLYNTQRRQGFLAWTGREAALLREAHPSVFAVREKLIQIRIPDRNWLDGAELLRFEPVEEGAATARLTFSSPALPNLSS